MKEKAEKALKGKTTEPFAQAYYFVTFWLSSPSDTHLYRSAQGI